MDYTLSSSTTSVVENALRSLVTIMEDYGARCRDKAQIAFVVG